MIQNQRKYGKGILIAIVLFSIAMLTYVSADPVGTTFNFQSNSTRGSVLPSSDAELGGTINVISLSADQQNSEWKAYVGNVSGTLTLDDSNNYTIYDWDISISGEVYAARNSSVTFTSIECAQPTVIASENTFYSFSATESDAINETFNATNHAAFSVGATAFSTDECSNVTYLYENSTRPADSSSNTWQEILLNSSNILVYVSLINNDANSYQNNTDTYDFQMILPDEGTPTTYYFWMELG